MGVICCKHEAGEVVIVNHKDVTDLVHQIPCESSREDVTDLLTDAAAAEGDANMERRNSGSWTDPFESQVSAASFDIQIPKKGHGDWLGLHLKARPDSIVVHSISNSCAVQRINNVRMAEGSMDYLRPGHMIVQVNGKVDTNEMIEECKTSLKVTLTVKDPG